MSATTCHCGAEIQRVDSDRLAAVLCTGQTRLVVWHEGDAVCPYCARGLVDPLHVALLKHPEAMIEVSKQLIADAEPRRPRPVWAPLWAGDGPGVECDPS